jgi:hypothetical protein
VPIQPQLGGIRTHRKKLGRLVELIWVRRVAYLLTHIQRDWFESIGVRSPANDALAYARALVKSRSAWNDEHYYFHFAKPHAENCGCNDHLAVKAVGDPFGIQQRMELPDWITDPMMREQAILELAEFIEHYLPSEVVLSEMERAAVQAWWVGKFQKEFERISVPKLKTAPARLPKDLDELQQRYPKATERELRIIRGVRDQGARDLQSATTKLKNGVRGVMENAVVSQQSGARTRQDLFYQFGAANRDWRMIGITESAIARTDGFLSQYGPGTVVRAMEAANCCDWCRENTKDREFVIIHPDDPRRDPRKHIWQGKTNRGLKQIDWTAAWGPNHPHCRMDYVFVSATKYMLEKWAYP